jgi:hypothetical protein
MGKTSRGGRKWGGNQGTGLWPRNDISLLQRELKQYCWEVLHFGSLGGKSGWKASWRPLGFLQSEKLSVEKSLGSKEGWKLEIAPKRLQEGYVCGWQPSRAGDHWFLGTPTVSCFSRETEPTGCAGYIERFILGNWLTRLWALANPKSDGGGWQARDLGRSFSSRPKAVYW